MHISVICKKYAYYMELPYEIPYYSHIFGKYAYYMHIEFIFVASGVV